MHDAGYDESRDVYYLVMDYVKGDTLRMALGIGGPRPEGESAGIILQIAGVLEMSQRFGLVHRDLKPENIMITPDGTVRLLDLGVAKVSSNVDSLRTMAASVFGTPNYIAPEQAIDSSTVDMRADIYSLGVILFELLAGRRPYSGKSMSDILRQLLDSAPIPDVREYAPGVSSALAQIIAKMCAKRPEDRYPGPAELIAALGAAGFRPDTARTAGFYAAEEERSAPGIAELLAASGASRGAGMNTMSDITLETQDPDMQEFLARRRRRKLTKALVKAAAAAAVLAAVAFAALKASAETVRVADCERDPDMDIWAAADVRYAREVMKDVFAKAGVEAQNLDFGDDGMFDPADAEVLRCAFRTPALCRDYDFPMQPLGRMHFALYATKDRAKEMLDSKIADWPRMRVGYSPVSQGRDNDRENYFERASLSPEFVEFKTSAEAVRALETKNVDLLFLYTPEGKRPEGLVEVVPIGSRNVYFAARKDRRELFNRLQKAYRECYIDNVERYDALRESLLGVPRPQNRVRVAAYLRGHLFALSPDGDRSGVIEDWFNAVAGNTRWTYDYVYGTYAESLKDVMDGRLDIVGGIGFTAERGETLLYPHTPIGMLRVYLWTKRNSRIKAGDHSTWRGMKVGLLSGSFSADRVKKKLEATGNPRGIVCSEYPTEHELMKAYFGGEVDACVDIETPALNNERALHVYVSHPMYVCVAPNRRDLFLELERAMDRVCDDFPKYMRMISERHYGIQVPHAEIEYIALLLETAEDDELNEKVIIVVATHGRNTASSMVEVAQKLFNASDSNLLALDMPLEVKPQAILDKLVAMLQTMNCRPGVLMLADMGSLCNFGAIIADKLHIQVRTLDMVSTPLILEAMRKSDIAGMDLDSIYESLRGFKGYEAVDAAPAQQQAQPEAIVTICTTGKGAALKLKSMVDEILAHTQHAVEVVPVGIAHLEERLEELAGHYRLLAAIGMKRPQRSMPFISLEQLLDGTGEQRLLAILDATSAPVPAQPLTEQDEDKRDIVVKKLCEDSLNQFLTYLNPVKVLPSLLTFDQQLEQSLGLNLSNPLRVRLIVHCGCALERIVTRSSLVYQGDREKLDERKVQALHHAAKVFEQALKLHFDEDELFYMANMI